MGCGPKSAYDDELEEKEEKTWKALQKLSRKDALTLLYDLRRLIKHVDETPQYSYIHGESNSLGEFLKKHNL